MAKSQFVSSSISETKYFGQGTDVGYSTVVFQIDVGTGWTGSFQPQKHVAGANTYRNSYFLNHFNNTVQLAVITGSGIYSMDITGCDAQIVHTMTSSGSVVFNYSTVRN